MVRAIVRGRLILVLAGLAAAIWIGAASAQSTGMVKGRVVDANGDAVADATILIEYLENVTRRHETKTNNRGDFIQIGLVSGNYRVTASKEKMGTQSFEVRVRLGDATEVNFALGVEAPGARSEEDLALAEAFRKVFDEGVAAARADSHDEAIAKFNEALKLVPACEACQYNIGSAYFKKNDDERAIEAFKKAIEIKQDYPEAYSALANIYNSQRKFDLAAEMSAQATKYAAAGEGGEVSAETIYNQGVILWNAGKIAEAKQQFEQAIKAQPGYADAHYWLAMANLNEGKLPEAANEFEEYLKLAPDGQYAAQAKGVLTQIKK